MAKSVNKKRKDVDSVIQYQMRDQIWSLTVVEKEDLIDFELDGKGNDVDITMESDFRKENVINTNTITNNTSGVTFSITHGENDTENNSTLYLNTTNLNAQFNVLFTTQITSLQNRVTALENRG